MWVDWKENPEKGLRQFLKSISKLKAEFLSVREKNNSFKIPVSILRYIRNVNLPFKDFKFAEPLTKISFFLYFRDRPKNGK